ncbi:Golgin sub A member 2 [Globomyces sp. JEL0801]|nr:Golgin sub A member 2 [Globomyces sp. JEL0801]
MKKMKEGRDILNRPKTAPNRKSPVLDITNWDHLINRPKESNAAKVEESTYDDALMGLGAKEETIGTEATTRFLKAKLHVLQKELDAMMNEKCERDAMVSSLKEKVKGMEQDKAKDQKQINQLQSQCDKNQTQVDVLQAKNTLYQSQITQLKKDLESVNRTSKTATTETIQKDLKVNRLVEEVEKYKYLMNQKQVEFKEQLELEKKKFQEIEKEYQKLNKQKYELLNGFKKQNQLIEILKRQKMHIEAAKLLQFTEDEFMKSLNID